MMPKYHLIYGFIFSTLIFYFFPSIKISGFLVLWASSIFIDLDHAVRYSIKTKNFNPIKFWKWSVKESRKRKNLDYSKYKYPVFFLHGIEFVIFLICLSFYFGWSKFLLIGVIFHLILDYIHLIFRKFPLDMKLSLIWTILRNKNKKPLPKVFL